MNVDSKCIICGEVLDEGFDFCDKHMDEAYVLLIAIMKAESIDDLIRAWQTWRAGQDGRKKTAFMDNCRNCGKAMWVWPWERKNGRHGGQYCGMDCSIEAKQGKSKDEASSFFKDEIFKSETAKNPDAVALGKLGGLKGGKARAEKLTPERRSEIASIAVKTRWAKQDSSSDLTVNSKCPKCGTRTLEKDGTDLHCWTCGHIVYYVFGEAKDTDAIPQYG